MYQMLLSLNVKLSKSFDKTAAEKRDEREKRWKKQKKWTKEEIKKKIKNQTQLKTMFHLGNSDYLPSYYLS